MTIFILILTGALGIIVSKAIFKHWFNPLSLYIIIWTNMLSLFELRLIPFYPLRTYTWSVIISAFLSLFLGILTIYLWQTLYKKEPIISNNVNIDILLKENGNVIKWLMIIFSIIGLFGALQHWSVLLKEFGSIAGVLINSIKVYNMRQAGELKGVIPYVWLFSFFAAFLAGIYTAIKGRITFISLLPIIGIILKDMAKIARNGILLGLFEYFISFIFCYFLINRAQIRKIKVRNLIISSLIVIILMTTAVSFIRVFRNPNENYAGNSSQLGKMKDNFLISPQIYFYAASQVGVLNQYLMNDSERLPLGSNTFNFFYNILAGVGLIQKVDTRPQPYFIPQWSNTATYLRDLNNDFGIAGILVGPFTLGILIMIFWIKFFNSGLLKHLLILTQLNLIIGMSFFVLATRMSPVTFTLIFLYPLFLYLEKIFMRKKKYSESEIIITDSNKLIQ